MHHPIPYGIPYAIPHPLHIVQKLRNQLIFNILDGIQSATDLSVARITRHLRLVIFVEAGLGHWRLPEAPPSRASSTVWDASVQTLICCLVLLRRFMIVGIIQKTDRLLFTFCLATFILRGTRIWDVASSRTFLRPTN